MQASDNLRFHHIGVVTRGIERELPFFEQLGYARASEIFVEQGQGIRGMLLCAPEQPALELLENIGANGPLSAPLARGIKFYHFAYATDDMDLALERLLKTGPAKQIVPVSNGDYFKRISFVMLPNMVMLELIEPRPGQDYSPPCPSGGAPEFSPGRQPDETRPEYKAR